MQWEGTAITSTHAASAEIAMTSTRRIDMKYEFTGETKISFGVMLRRIRALRYIARFEIMAGELGGWIEKDSSLDQSGDAWVSGDARVSNSCA
jgi:hypothetical protein